jgi:dTDP-4-amino-4,6-dideoxygalactose transaminase
MLRKARIPLLDLAIQHTALESELREAFERVLRSQVFILGPEVERLEKWAAEYSQCRHSLGVSSGTDALLLALMAAEIGPGDEVITSPFSFFASAGVIARVGAKPVFVDIDPTTFNLDPSRLAGAVNARTKAVIAVHLYGQMADMGPISELCRARNLLLIEDAAQSLGAEYSDGRRAGSIGHIGCFSFFPSKNLGALGDAGIVTTNDSDLAERMKILRVHGAKPKYYHHLIGGNFRLDAIQAAFLNVKAKYLDHWTSLRQRNAVRYGSLLSEMTALSLPHAVYKHTGAKHFHIYNQFVVRVKERDALKKHLETQGVGSEIYYPVPFHLQECFAYLQYRPGDFPHAEAASKESLAIPIYPELPEEMQTYVAHAIRDWYDTTLGETDQSRVAQPLT